MNKLKNIIKDINPIEIRGKLDVEINNVVDDSRQVNEGVLFICIEGANYDAHSFIQQAIRDGARAFVIEKELDTYPPECTYIRVNNSRRAMGYIASAYYDYPLDDLTLIGVTGTNGKTTTTFLIKSILDYCGCETGLIGTIEVLVPGNSYPSTRTTPESLELYKYFKKMVDRGVSYAVMEVSSHALALHRIAGMNFDVGVFTNISRDHLDYHKSLENYLEAKCILFKKIKDNGYGIINCDDSSHKKIIESTVGKVFTYGIENQADYMAENIKIDPSGVCFSVQLSEKIFVDFNLSGRFNVYNALAAIGTCKVLGVKEENIKLGLESIEGVPGRFEMIDRGQDFSVIVDYAHTPDGMENVLKTAIRVAENNVIVVFGCGGDRDKNKRPQMGKIGGKLADYCIITSDNPRSEKEADILAQIKEGISDLKNSAPYEVIPDRGQAIFRAIEIAETGDMVLIIGKGHETYQVFKDRTIHFDDREVAREALRERGYNETN